MFTEVNMVKLSQKQGKTVTSNKKMSDIVIRDSGKSRSEI